MTKPDAGDRFLKAVGARVRRAREERRLTQGVLAVFCRLDRTHIGEIERGTTNASLAVLWKLASALGVDPAALLPTRDEVDLPATAGARDKR